MGSRDRSVEEESKLQEFMPVLTKLSDPGEISGLPKKEAAAMADMSGYALSLVATRMAPSKGVAHDTHFGGLSTQPDEQLRKVLKDAEKDLKSTQPPLRARAMVSLGKLARGFSGTLVKERTRPKVEELDESGNSLGEEEAFFVKEVLRLAMMALLDSESYVYLAAIQTIVALCDMHPRTVLPILATSVVSGKVELKDGNDDEIAFFELSREQRIKLADALVFSIRRRAVTDEYVSMLVGRMLDINERNGLIGEVGASTDEQLVIQEKTTKYFLGKDRKNHEEMTKYEEREEQDVRVRTGGPIFDAEEADAIRAELVTHLESMDGKGISGNHAFGIPFASALVSSDEDRLHASLQQYVTGNIKTATDRIQDEATLVRCEEGLRLRDEAEHQGFFVAARIVLDNQNVLDKLPAILRISSPRIAMDDCGVEWS
ncbi:MAG: hypothetical protein SGARI_003779 [Bacillariaceae sp.]